jgi:hypothetical protein
MRFAYPPLGGCEGEEEEVWFVLHIVIIICMLNKGFKLILWSLVLRGRHSLFARAQKVSKKAQPH